MIFYQQRNIAAFAGNFRSFWILQPFRQLISATSAAAPPTGPIAGSLALTGVGI